MVGFSTHTLSKKRFLKENQASTHTYFPGIFSVSFCNVFSFFYFYFLFIYFFVLYLYFLFIFYIYISIFYFYLYFYFYFLFLFSISIFYFFFLFLCYVLYFLFLFLCTVCSIYIYMYCMFYDGAGMERLDTLSLNHNVMSELGPGWFEGRPAVYPSIKTFEKSAKNVIVCFLPINQNFPNIP